MLYSAARSSHSSTSTFTMTTFSAYLFWNSSSFGAITLHGPHQVAKKSTTTSWSPADSSLLWKSAESLTMYTIFTVFGVGIDDIQGTRYERTRGVNKSLPAHINNNALNKA
uniref:Uncharacterized protein n=1 Tax=Anopheles aquasalis TaxID=42839 RepID=T1E861_ANOAQ